MKVTIPSKLWTDQIGTAICLPFSSYEVKIFPTLLQFNDVDSNKSHEIVLGLKGPLLAYYLELNIERSEINCRMQLKDGFVSFTILAKDQAIFFKLERHFEESIKVNGKPLNVKKEVELFKAETFEKERIEKLFLGELKTKSILELIQKDELESTLPSLFQLGQQVKPLVSPVREENFLLLDTLKTLKREKKECEQGWALFFKMAITGIFSPRAKDQSFQGIYPSYKGQLQSSAILYEAYLILRSYFFIEEEGHLTFLPHLFSYLHQGKLFQLQTEVGVVSFEWSRGEIRTVEFEANQTTALTFTFPKGLKTCRLLSKNHSSTMKGKTFTFDATQGSRYRFDNFKR